MKREKQGTGKMRGENRGREGEEEEEEEGGRGGVPAGIQRGLGE